MGKKQRRKQPQHKGRGSSQPARSGRKRKPLGWRGLGRRLMIGIGILALPALVVGLEVRENLRLSDLSVIGSGKPVVVQAHDPECPSCRSLLGNAEAAHAGLEDDVAFRVINLRTSEGRAFARRFDVGKVTLVLFDRDGDVKGTLRGVQSVEALRRVFRKLDSDSAESS